MAQRTQQRPGTARFGRHAAGRPRASSARTGRFAATGTPSARLGGLPAGRSRTQAATPARRPFRGPAKSKPSGAGKLLSGLTGMLPTGGRSKSGGGVSKGKSAGGLAALAGLAGLAFKNRDKLTNKLGGGGKHASEHVTTPAPGDPLTMGAANSTTGTSHPTH